jgi:hypothetical protein
MKAFDLNAGDHRFDFIRGVCTRCGMSIETFKDKGRPACTWQPAGKRSRPTVPPDDDPSGAA